MLPNNQPPPEVMELVNKYKADPTHYELVIHDNMFFLYSQIVEQPEDKTQPARVRPGSFITRAYWRDAAGISQEMMKARLGIR